MLKLDFLTRDYEMAEIVYNTEKKTTQVVLAKIPRDKRKCFEVPKRKKAYICTGVESTASEWTVELGENLRHATVYERFGR